MTTLNDLAIRINDRQARQDNATAVVEQNVDTVETDFNSKLSSLTNTVSSNYNNTVKTSGNQTVSGTKTFSSITSTNTQTFNLVGTPLTAGTIKPVINVKYTDDTLPAGTMYNSNIVSVIGGGATETAYNSTVMFCSPNGTAILAAGESSQHMPRVCSLYNSENAYVVADANIVMYTGCANDAASYKQTLTLDSSGNAKILGNVIPNNGSGATIKQTYVSGTTWYRIWTDGWIEQGGYASIPSAGTTITFPKAFSNTKYYLNANGSQNTAGYRFCSFYNRSTTGSACTLSDDSSFNSGYIYWYACGK